MTRENVCVCGVQIDFFSLNTFHLCLVEAMNTEHVDTGADYTGFNFAVQNSNEEQSDDSVGKTLALRAQGLEFHPQNRPTNPHLVVCALIQCWGVRDRRMSSVTWYAPGQ